MIKTKTIKIEEMYCDLCGDEIEGHFGEMANKCFVCGRDMCPNCTNAYKVEITKVRDYTCYTKVCKELSKTLCWECGNEFEDSLF